MYKKIVLIISFFYVNSLMAVDCRSGQYFVSAHHRDSYYRKDGKLVSAADVEAHCREYHFSSPLKVKFESKMPEGWPYQLDLFRPWTKGEKKEVQKTLNSLPEKLRNLGEIKIYRAIKSAFPNNHASSGPDDGIIVLYDSIKKFGYKQALAHEMAHILFSKLNEDEKIEYYSFSNWKENNGKLYAQRKDFSEPDGVFSPEEDFANNTEHLVFKNNSRVNSAITDYLKPLLGLKK